LPILKQLQGTGVAQSG